MHRALTTNLEELSPGTVVVCPFFEDDSLADVPALRQTGGERLSAMLSRGEVQPRRYEATVLPPGLESHGVMFVGAGDRESHDVLYQMRVAAAASRYLTGRGYREIGFLDRGVTSPIDLVHATVEGAIRGAYNAELKKRAPEQRRQLDAITLVSERLTSQDVDEGWMRGEIAGRSSCIARDLVNMPPNELTPIHFADRAQKLSVDAGIEYDVLDEAAMRAEGMGSLLGVAAGSANPPRLIVMRYGSRNAPLKLALVGKGLTFDSGGLSLKTAEGMVTMKGDMGGGAAVVAGMVGIAGLAPGDVSVTGYVGAVENMPDGRAMRPGDVLTAMSGETIEVLNTDAEGRLVLADLLALARRDGATHIVDFATLTGGAVVALGHVATLATGHPAEWVAQVVDAAGAGLERAWPMPLYPEYREAMDSTIADIKNTGGRYGSPLTAAAFLRDFADGVPWAHMDIAGTAFAENAAPYQPAGGTGEGVATILSLVRRLSQE